jgi:hypothetical protein
MKGKIDWIFYIQIEKRDWFKRFWKSRGSNCLNIQFFKWHISIGMPWLQDVVDKADVLYPLSGINHFHKTNEANREGVKRHGRIRFVRK